MAEKIYGEDLTAEEKAEFLKSVDMDKIIAWCKKNGELAWLEAKMAETVTRHYYPYVKERGADGKLKCKLDENGRKIVDYTKPPRTKQVPIGFMEIKKDFIDTYLPYLRPAKKTKTKKTMRDKLAAAIAE